MAKDRRRANRRPIAEMNVVPYIDVMLVLLVIFMITAPLLAQGVRVDLPQAASETLPAQERDPVIITVDIAGRLFLNPDAESVAIDDGSAPLEPRALITAIAARRALDPDVPVLIKGAAQAPYEYVVRAMSLAQQAGVDGVGLVTDSPDEESPGAASDTGVDSNARTFLNANAARAEGT